MIGERMDGGKEGGKDGGRDGGEGGGKFRGKRDGGRWGEERTVRGVLFRWVRRALYRVVQYFS